MITVLICVHSTNKQNDKFLSDALLSLRVQTYKDFKTVILLDECWDRTKTMLETFRFDCDDFLVIEKDKKEGLGYAKNYGLSFVETEYVAFSDADDLTKIIEEIATTRTTERGGRADDKRAETAMEDRKKQGYF